MDLGGGTFAGMEDLAHMAGVALRGDDERINRMLAEIVSIINARERYFKANKIDSIGTYRQLRDQGKAATSRTLWAPVWNCGSATPRIPRSTAEPP